jgi:hypothetical protein
MTEEEAEELKRQQQPVEFKKKTKKKVCRLVVSISFNSLRKYFICLWIDLCDQVAVRRKAEDAADDEVIEGSTFVLPEPSAEEQSADRGSRDRFNFHHSFLCFKYQCYFSMKMHFDCRSRKVAAEEAAAAELNSRRYALYSVCNSSKIDFLICRVDIPVSITMRPRARRPTIRSMHSKKSTYVSS